MNQQPSPTRRDKKQQIYKAFLNFMPEWKQTKIEDVKLERMAGITNETYKVSRNGDQTAFIYREFGDASDNIFLDRKAEEFVYQFISDSKAGPRIYGMTEDVRIEEFIVSKVLKTSQMLENPIIQDIAFALRRFHEISPKSEQCQKSSLFNEIFFKQDSKILQKCHRKMQKKIFTAEQQKILKNIQNWVSKSQIQFLKKITIELQKSHLIFSHNDLLAGNVLIRSEDKKIIFIDYEYSCYNYQVYDIANYFNQAIIDYDVKEAPFFKIKQLTQEQNKNKDKFIRCYAMAQEKKFKKYKSNIHNEGYELTESMKNLEKMMKEQLIVGQMLSNLMWGYWAIIVSKNPQIDFDYIAFAQYRYQQYSSMKQYYLKSNSKQ